MKKEKYELYTESFKSCIDNEYHVETYYTAKKDLKNKRDLYLKSSDKSDTYMTISLMLLFLCFLFTSVGLYVLLNDCEKIPGVILTSLGGGSFIFMLIFGRLFLKYNTISEHTSEWKREFTETNEFKQQQQKYIQQYEKNALRKKSEKAKKLIDIYDNLDDKKISKEEKILNIAKILNIKDVD